MNEKNILWNNFGLEDYLERLVELPDAYAEKVVATVKEAFKKLPAAVHLNPYHDKDRGIRKMNHSGEIILYREHELEIEIVGIFSERSNWMNNFRNY